jgi:hypothetical protein
VWRQPLARPDRAAQGRVLSALARADFSARTRPPKVSRREGEIRLRKAWSASDILSDNLRNNMDKKAVYH